MGNKLISIKLVRFRKLKDIKIDIANRLTVIAGHNGIGKSTILGLIANGSELKGQKSYFDKIFQAQFQEIFHLDLDNDYIKEQEKKYSVLIEYCYEGVKLYKRCTVSRHTDRLKVVPRNATEDGILTNSPVEDVGADAKVTIPTIYIGMSRVIPIGESDKDLYSLTTSSNIDRDDVDFLNNSYREIIGNERLDEDKVSKQKLRHSTKRSVGPDFKDYPYQSVSLGQDSLSTILTALISFRKLKREIKDEYKGGILLIDEIDACLHPSAQEKLVQVIDKASKNLNLQVIFTSHSLTVIKEVMGRKLQTSQNPADGKLYYNVIYIQNTIRPTVMKNPTYKKIKNDMFLRFTDFQDNKQHVKLYLEDEEALFFFETILNNCGQLDLDGIRLDRISAQISCDTLLKLPSKDKYFESVIIITDGDVKSRSSNVQIIDEYQNICTLPGDMSPEETIHSYLESIIDDIDHPFWIDNQEVVHSQIVRDNLLKKINDHLKSASDKKRREYYKEWFIQFKPLFNKTQLLRYWMNDHVDELGEFIYQFNIAVNYIRKHYLKNDI